MVRFELSSGDIQLSSALRILSVLDMVERKQEGNLLLRREGKTLIALSSPCLLRIWAPGAQWNRNASVALRTLHHSSKN